MTDHKITPDAPVLEEIDTSKHRHEILIEVFGKKRRRRLTIQNTREDYNRPVALLTDYGKPVRIAFEATGNYRKVLADHLGKATSSSSLFPLQPCPGHATARNWPLVEQPR